MATFHCEIVSAEASVLSVEATEVLARSLDGEFGILAGHQPILAALEIAPVTVHEEGGAVHHLAVHHGFLFFRDNKLVVLADIAEKQADIDAARAEETLRARESEQHREDMEDAEVKASIRRQQVRLTVARR